jgi:hypothetical protein
MEHETLEENRSSPDPASPSSASLPVVIDIDPAQAITPQLSRAFARFAGHDVGVLRFAPDRPIPRELVPLLDRYMPTSVQLAKLVLIHPSATAGFIASTLALRHPRVQIAAATQWTDPTSVR